MKELYGYFEVERQMDWISPLQRTEIRYIVMPFGKKKNAVGTWNEQISLFC